MKQHHEKPAEALIRLDRDHQQKLADGADYLAIWQLFLESEAFRELVSQTALRVCLRNGLPRDCRDDLTQSAFLSFAELIERHSDLNYQADKGNYRQWLSLLVNSCCSKALRQFRDRTRQSGEHCHDPVVPDKVEEIQAHIDLIMVINEMPDPIRFCVVQDHGGESITSISQAIGCSERSVYRWLARGQEMIEKRLA